MRSFAFSRVHSSISGVVFDVFSAASIGHHQCRRLFGCVGHRAGIPPASGVRRSRQHPPVCPCGCDHGNRHHGGGKTDPESAGPDHRRAQRRRCADRRPTCEPEGRFRADGRRGLLRGSRDPARESHDQGCPRSHGHIAHHHPDRSTAVSRCRSGCGRRRGPRAVGRVAPAPVDVDVTLRLPHGRGCLPTLHAGTTVGHSRTRRGTTVRHNRRDAGDGRRRLGGPPTPRRGGRSSRSTLSWSVSGGAG